MATDRHREVVLGGALLAAVSSGVWFGALADRGERLPPAPPAVEWPVEPSPTPAMPSIQAPAAWDAPQPQRRGDDWVYEVFTPPEIRFDPAAGRLAATRAGAAHSRGAARELGTGAVIPLALKAVVPVPFRLQLAGFVGRGETLRGVFENILSGELLLAGARTQLGSLAITVEDVRVERRAAAAAGDAADLLPLAVAVVRDERTGARVTLTTNARALTPELMAVVAPAAPAGVEKSVREGDLIREGDVVYRIEKIQLAPPAVSVSTWGAGQLAPESHTLVLQPEPTAERSSGTL